jgi:hypothetical protein
MGEISVRHHADPSGRRVSLRGIGSASLGAPPPGCRQMTPEEWAAAEKSMTDSWVASGKSTQMGLCAVVTYPGQEPQFMQQCFHPDGGSGGTSGAASSFGDSEFPPSCEEIWKRFCQSVKPGEYSYEACQAGAQPTTQEAAPSAPEGPSYPQDIQSQVPTAPVTNLPSPAAGFQTPCNPGRPTMGVGRISRDLFGRSMF